MARLTGKIIKNEILIDNILESIAEEFEGVSFRNLTEDESKRIHESVASNLAITPQIYIHPGRKLIAITDRSLYRHWLYFAAFEYIEHELMIETREAFVVVYGGQEGTVWEFFETLAGRLGMDAVADE